MIRAVAAASIFAVGTLGTAAAEQVQRRASLMWSAFVCAQYATLAGKIDEPERLFQLGYRIGQDVMGDAKADRLTPEEIKEMPVIIRFLMSGPTTEFILGRIYESAVQNAFDTVVKKDNIGTLLPMDRWAMDEELRKALASSKFHQQNCVLLK